jgi:hypothetical protein
MIGKPNVKLKTLLFEWGTTQRQLAFGIGVDEGLISKAIRYGIVTKDIREKIAVFLGLPQCEIFEGEEFEHEPGDN